MIMIMIMMTISMIEIMMIITITMMSRLAGDVDQFTAKYTFLYPRPPPAFYISTVAALYLHTPRDQSIPIPSHLQVWVF